MASGLRGGALLGHLPAVGLPVAATVLSPTAAASPTRFHARARGPWQTFLPRLLLLLPRLLLLLLRLLLLLLRLLLLLVLRLLLLLRGLLLFLRLLSLLLLVLRASLLPFLAPLRGTLGLAILVGVRLALRRLAALALLGWSLAAFAAAAATPAAAASTLALAGL